MTVVLWAADPVLPRKAPELAFSVPGQGEKLLSQYRGKVVALEFILTTCPHCQAAAQMMSRLQAEYGPRGFQALDVAIDGLDEGRTAAQANDLVQRFANNYQVAFPVGYTPRDQMLTFSGFSFADRFVVPQIVLIDRKGVIHYQTPPLGDEYSMQESTLRQRIGELLSASSATPAHRPSTGASKKTS